MHIIDGVSLLSCISILRPRLWHPLLSEDKKRSILSRAFRIVSQHLEITNIERKMLSKCQRTFLLTTFESLLTRTSIY